MRPTSQQATDYLFTPHSLSTTFPIPPYCFPHDKTFTSLAPPFTWHSAFPQATKDRVYSPNDHMTTYTMYTPPSWDAHVFIFWDALGKMIDRPIS